MNLIFIFLSFYISTISSNENLQLTGAWKHVEGDVTTVLLFEDGYFASASYTKTAFVSTWGGTFKVEANSIIIQTEFNTTEKELRPESVPYKITRNTLQFGNRKFESIDNGIAPLSGVWKITGRMVDGKIIAIQHTGTRKTLKMLTGKRFQWFAIDPSGNKFSGTGGGTYSFQNGKYIENIEFFSRDSSRVGASLSFDDHLEDEKWHHTGLSSKGDKIYEIWEKIIQ